MISVALFVVAGRNSFLGGGLITSPFPAHSTPQQHSLVFFARPQTGGSILRWRSSDRTQGVKLAERLEVLIAAATESLEREKGVREAIGELTAAEVRMCHVWYCDT